LALLLALLVLAGAFLSPRSFLAVTGGGQPSTVIAIAGRLVAVWKPAGPPPAKGYPLILFSHGFTGCGTQSRFLTEALAQAGYFVIAPNHHDALCGEDEADLFAKLASTRPKEPFGNPGLWSAATYQDRRDDVEAVLDAVLKDQVFPDVPIDAGCIGLAGHSLGGYTVLGLAGAWPSWRDPRVKAVLALSPFCTPYIKKGDLPHLRIPVMYQGGSMDVGITPTVRSHGGAYELTSAPKFFVDFSGAGHFAWTNLNRTYQPVINNYALAFFDRYLKGNIGPADQLAEILQPPWPDKVDGVEFTLK
jgi:predicted dienelactone hydrolase